MQKVSMYGKMTKFRGSKGKPRRRKESEKERKRFLSHKLALLFVTIVLALCALILYIGSIAVTKNEEYTKKSLTQLNYQSSTIVAKSGDILDRNMTPVALSERVYILILDPKVITETTEMEGRGGSLDATVNALVQCFGLDEEDVRRVISENTSRSYLRYQQNGSKTVLSDDQVTAFNEMKESYNDLESEERKQNPDDKSIITGVWFETEYRRTYPFNDLESKVIGFTTQDTTEGLWGLELTYNDVLRGTNGRQFGHMGDGSSLNTETVPAEDGCSLVTTLDMNMSRIVSEVVEEWSQEVGGKSISVLLMNPQNGEILSMYDSTNYNLNDPTDLSGIYTEEELEHPESLAVMEDFYTTDEQKQKLTSMTYEEKILNLRQLTWRNFIISNTFEPGSTAKPLTVAAAMEEGTVVPSDTFTCAGSLDVAGTLIRCHNYAKGGCGTIDLAGALANSCNVALMEIGEELGRDEFYRYENIFNLGQKTGIDLPGEASGLLFEKDQLNITELATSSFGQGYNATMIQIAAATCSLLNGGYHYKPYVVKQVVDSSGNVVQETEPEIVRETVSQETSEFMKDAFYLTVEAGTGGGSKIAGYHIGGKTGTAEKLPRGNGKYLVSIITAVPIEEPELLLYVVIDEPNVENQADSEPAQRLAGRLLERLMPYAGIYSDNDESAEEYDWEENGESLSTDDQWPVGDSFLEDPKAADTVDGGQEEELPSAPADDPAGQVTQTSPEEREETSEPVSEEGQETPESASEEGQETSEPASEEGQETPEASSASEEGEGMSEPVSEENQQISADV